jgi:hypothetical protein
MKNRPQNASELDFVMGGNGRIQAMVGTFCAVSRYGRQRPLRSRDMGGQ